MDKDTRKKIRQDIDQSTIPEEMSVLYMMANATDIMCNMIFNRIKAVYVRNGYKINENELLTGINDYCKSVKMASAQFFQRIEPQVQGATWGRHQDDEHPDAPGDTDAYNHFMDDGNEICRLVLLYTDRCAKSQQNYGKIFKTLRQLPSGGLIKDEDISRYKMK